MNPEHGAVNGVSPVTTTASNNIGGNLSRPTGNSGPSPNTMSAPNTRIPVPTRAPAANAPAAINRPAGPTRSVPGQPTPRHVPRHGSRPNIIGYKIRQISTLRRYCVPVTTILLVLASVVVIAILIKVVLDNYYYFCVKSFKFIPLEKWCDGQSDCAGDEDERRCAQKVTFNNITTVRFTDSGSVLQILSQGIWRYICYDGFDTAKAKVICAQIGFSSEPSFSSVSATELNGPFSNVLVSGAGVQTIPTSGTVCASGSVVSLRCIACGINHKKERIVGGQATSIENSPWQASLEFAGQHLCGGSIINKRYILTAAHCFPKTQQQVDRWRVEVGHSSLGYIFANQIDKIYIYPFYNLDHKPHDIALLKLKYDLSFSETIQPVCLPGFDNSLPDGAPLTVTGWGHTVEGGGSISQTLLGVSINLISSDTCNSEYYGQILDTMMCAGRLSGGADTCQGDSGGPLVFLNHYWQQVGIVSWGDGCGRPNKVGVYTKVAPYVPWIFELMSMDQ